MPSRNLQNAMNRYHDPLPNRFQTEEDSTGSSVESDGTNLALGEDNGSGLICIR